MLKMVVLHSEDSSREAMERHIGMYVFKSSHYPGVTGAFEEWLQAKRPSEKAAVCSLCY